MRTPLVLLALALLLVVAGCDRSVDAPVSAGGADENGGSATPETSPSDGALDFSAISGTWSGQLEMVIFGENPAGTVRLDLEIEESAERSSVVGTTAWSSNCGGTLSAITASPPIYEFRERVPSDLQGDCAPWRIRVTHDPGSEVLEFDGRWRDITGSGTLRRGSGS